MNDCILVFQIRLSDFSRARTHVHTVCPPIIVPEMRQKLQDVILRQERTVNTSSEMFL